MSQPKEFLTNSTFLWEVWFGRDAVNFKIRLPCLLLISLILFFSALGIRDLTVVAQCQQSTVILATTLTTEPIRALDLH